MSLQRITELLELDARGMRQKATGAAAIAVTLAPATRFRIREIRIHLSAAGGAGNLTVTVNAADGAAYDTVLLTQNMTAVTDYLYKPDYPLQFESGDEVDIAWANGGTKTYGLVIIYDLL